jgi:hypothetical protein
MRLALRLNHGIADNVKEFCAIIGSRLCRCVNFGSLGGGARGHLSRRESR